MFTKEISIIYPSVLYLAETKSHGSVCMIYGHYVYLKTLDSNIKVEICLSYNTLLYQVLMPYHINVRWSFDWVLKCYST